MVLFTLVRQILPVHAQETFVLPLSDAHSDIEADICHLSTTSPQPANFSQKVGTTHNCASAICESDKRMLPSLDSLLSDWTRNRNTLVLFAARLCYSSRNQRTTCISRPSILSSLTGPDRNTVGFFAARLCHGTNTLVPEHWESSASFNWVCPQGTLTGPPEYTELEPARNSNRHP